VADFRRSRGFGDAGGESLDAIARTDQLLDALAIERRIPPVDAGDAELFALLGEWRDEVRWPPATDLVSERDAAAALRDGVNAMPARRGGHRGLTIVASLAAAVLCAGGFGAVVGTAGPGDPLYGMRTTLFGESKEVRGDQVALASAQMAQVQQLIKQGDWEQAQQKLQAVSTQVQAVDDVGTKTDLIQQWNELSVKVGTRDPAATLPPVEPGAPPVEPPPGVTLLELPPLITTTTSVTDTSTSATTSETSSSSEAPTSSETPTTSETPPTSDTPVSETPPTSETATSTPAASTSPSAAPATTSVTTTAPTTTAPTSSAAPTTSTAPPTTSSVAQQAVTTTSAAPAAPASQAPASSSVAVATTTVIAPSPAEVSQPPARPAEPTVAQTAPQRAPDVVTTTMPRPVLPLPVLGGN
jgi:Anti-sigma-D factor RsdA to sigma factor binding region